MTSNNQDFPGRIKVQEHWQKFNEPIYRQPAKVDKPKNPMKDILKVLKEAKEKKSRTRKNAFNPPMKETFNIDDLVEKVVRVLKVSVEREVLSMIKAGKMEVLVIKNTYQRELWRKLRKPSGVHKEYDFIQMSVGYGSDEKVVTKYRGFYVAGHNHSIKISDNYSFGIPEGSIIIKFGEENVNN